MPTFPVLHRLNMAMRMPTYSPVWHKHPSPWLVRKFPSIATAELPKFRVLPVLGLLEPSDIQNYLTLRGNRKLMAPDRMVCSGASPLKPIESMITDKRDKLCARGPSVQHARLYHPPGSVARKRCEPSDAITLLIGPLIETTAGQ